MLHWDLVDSGSAASDSACELKMSKVLLLTALLLIPASTLPLSGQAPTAEAPVRGQVYQLVEGGLSDELRQQLGPDRLALLEKLNRADVAHLRRLSVLVIPASGEDDELRHSPLPLTYGWASGFPKAIVVHLPSQTFGAYEQGSLVRWGPISSGRAADPTPSGLFALNWKSPGRRSSMNPAWLLRWYFNFERKRGIAFHQHPLPGRPVSHACVRLLERDARWLYDWGERRVADKRGTVVTPGTPVLILGQYDFGAPPPWLSLDRLAEGVELPEEVQRDPIEISGEAARSGLRRDPQERP